MVLGGASGLARRRIEFDGKLCKHVLQFRSKFYRVKTPFCGSAPAFRIRGESQIGQSAARCAAMNADSDSCSVRTAVIFAVEVSCLVFLAFICLFIFNQTVAYV